MRIDFRDPDISFPPPPPRQLPQTFFSWRIAKKAPKRRKSSKKTLHIAKNTFSHFPGERREGLYTLTPPPSGCPLENDQTILTNIQKVDWTFLQIFKLKLSWTFVALYFLKYSGRLLEVQQASTNLIEIFFTNVSWVCPQKPPARRHAQFFAITKVAVYRLINLTYVYLYTYDINSLILIIVLIKITVFSSVPSYSNISAWADRGDHQKTFLHTTYGDSSDLFRIFAYNM